MPSRFEKDNSVDTRRGDVAMHVDMSPTTLLEENMMGGFNRTSKPVGGSEAERANINGSGSRGTTDAIAAEKLGIPVVNK